MTSRPSLRKRQLRLSLRSRGALVLTRLLKRVLEDVLQILGLCMLYACYISSCHELSESVLKHKSGAGK
jgi:hypothetical protein